MVHTHVPGMTVREVVPSTFLEATGKLCPRSGKEADAEASGTGNQPCEMNWV